MKTIRFFRTVAFLAACLSWSVASAEQHAIDAGKSTMKVRVYKAGVLSAFGHDHEISAPISRGTVDTSANRVELETKAAALEVRDQGISDKDRTEIQTTMLGPKVLDVEHYPNIVFRSTGAEPLGDAAWRVTGTLAMHGQTRTVTVDVHEAGGHFQGAARLKQSDFGIQPVRVAGGTVRVKDEVRIEFDIQLAR